MTDNAKRTVAAIEAHYQFLAWLAPTVEKFPKSHKFTAGDRIHGVALDVLEALIEATYTRERTQHLRRANLGIEKLRFLYHRNAAFTSFIPHRLTKVPQVCNHDPRGPLPCCRRDRASESVPRCRPGARL